MSEFFEIAYATASNRLCLFTGTGFSKAITNDDAPSWVDLLKEICQLLPKNDLITQDLFPEDISRPLSLEETAQVIAIELQKIGKNIYTEIVSVINRLDLKITDSSVREFFRDNSYKVITTNYDKLAEELAGFDRCHSISPGLPIPRSQAHVKVYHVHGSVDSPDNMVVTSNDYFHFINEESYFSRKLSTILHENTIVILGYSLSDTNLKAIISAYKGFSRNHLTGSNIFFVSRSAVSQYVKDYYSHCYGIRVIDKMPVDTFFSNLNSYMDTARKQKDESIANIKKVLYQNHTYSESYLKVENSFFEIISSISAIGLSVKEEKVVNVLGKIIETKTNLTNEYNAWDQYDHLAKWLIHIGCVLEIKDTMIEEIYLKSVLRSMNTMRKDLYIGYSWQAYKSWDSKWSSVIYSNRILIKTYIEEHSNHLDALSVVERF